MCMSKFTHMIWLQVICSIGYTRHSELSQTCPTSPKTEAIQSQVTTGIIEESNQQPSDLEVTHRIS